MISLALRLVVVCGLLLAVCWPVYAQTAVRGSLSTRPLASDAFRHGRSIHFPDGEVITLLRYKPVQGITAFPGGPPLRVPRGYKVVETRWAVHNTTGHSILIKTWRAKSRGRVSAMFITGNAAERGDLPPRGTWRYYWLFIVADTGPVAIYYGPFHAAWHPRG